MLDQILWLDALLKLAAGVLLILLPDLVARAAGLPRAQQPFYARLLGATLLGLGLAIVMESRRRTGLAPSGAFVVNLTGSTVLAAILLFGRIDLAWRGRILAWGLLAVLVLLASVELAFA